MNWKIINYVYIRKVVKRKAKTGSEFYTFFFKGGENWNINASWFDCPYELKDNTVLCDLTGTFVKNGEYLNFRVRSAKLNNANIPVKSTETPVISTIEDKPMETPKEDDGLVDISEKENWDALVNNYNGEKI